MLFLQFRLLTKLNPGWRVEMDSKQKSVPVAILPMGDISYFELRMISMIIWNAFHLESALLPRAKIPAFISYNERRGQWNADELINYLFGFLAKKTGRIIGVLNEDMYTWRRTFVYGYAHSLDGVALISLVRLREGWRGLPEDRRKLYNRVQRTVVHELGHTFGLEHCENSCIMHEVTGDYVSQVDSLNKNFCVSCNDRVRDAKKINPLSPSGLYNRAQALMRHCENREAAEIFSELAGINPLNADYHIGLGRALLNCEKFKEARPAFWRAIELGLQNSPIYYSMGIIDGKEHGAQTAEKWFERAIEKEPEKLRAHRHVANIYDSILKDADLARKHCLEYFRLGGNESDMKLMATRLGLTI